jgi:protein-S-isoprenylcysteine O-methyltransferase Ste14
MSAGIILLLIGLAMIVITRRHFSQAGQPTDPGIPTTRIITTGPFAWSRNPLYLGAVLIFIGLGGLFHSLWFLVFLLPTVLAVHLILIVPEERYLAATFGESYRQYSRVVRRWVGRRG